MTKSELRKKKLKQLNEMQSNERTLIEKTIVYNFLSSTLYKNAQIIGITISQGIEWNTKPIIESAWRNHKTICVPKCNPKDHTMKFYKLEQFEQLEEGFAKILEPKIKECMEVKKNDIDLLVVPGILFDKNGYRIGYGGGFYDRYLVDFHGVTVSIAANQQIVEKVPTNRYDIPVQYIITENDFIQI